jgi:hypothetical protein
MFRQFKFEESLYQKLEKIPVSTLFKLETLGLTMPLEVWERLAMEERWVLCHMAIRSRGEKECYRDYLFYLLKRQNAALPAKPALSPSGNKPWEEISRLPSAVAQKAKDLNLQLFWPEWIKLDDMERYIVFKLCKENSDDVQIRKVVEELIRQPSLSHPPNR